MLVIAEMKSKLEWEDGAVATCSVHETRPAAPLGRDPRSTNSNS